MPDPNPTTPEPVGKRWTDGNREARLRAAIVGKEHLYPWSQLADFLALLDAARAELLDLRESRRPHPDGGHVLGMPRVTERRAEEDLTIIHEPRRCAGHPTVGHTRICVHDIISDIRAYKGDVAAMLADWDGCRTLAQVEAAQAYYRDRAEEIDGILEDRRRDFAEGLARQQQRDADAALGRNVRAIVADHSHVEIEEFTDGFEAHSCNDVDWPRCGTLDAAVAALAAQVGAREGEVG